ncbi:MAG TPA: response regulator transcription factor [Solirubrobacteraceae bacterium]|jgi:DNA-binding response OmpR family regulator|nr:response regulator transcription factor [Solirubrobacteraceae bacterium]
MALDSVGLAKTGGDVQSILLVEHEPEIAAPLVAQLSADGYPTTVAHTVEHARAIAAMFTPALVILGDLDSPGGALELLSSIRSDGAPWPAYLPVIVLGSPARSVDLLRAFAAGADDFFACPSGWGREDDQMSLGYLELLARLRSLLRRAAQALEPALPRLCVGPLVIDTGSRAVLLHDQPVSLRPREYALLLHLAHEPTRVFAKHDLLRAIWGFQAPARTRTLDSHASRLRGKLVSCFGERWVISVRGVGYRLTD